MMTIRRILLVNPNSSAATTAMMLAIAQDAAGAAFELVGATATRAPVMIVDPGALAAAAAEVVEIATARAAGHDGVIVAAFGDPGLTGVRLAVRMPVVGIAEAAMLEAAGGGRRFGVATTTPALAASILATVKALGLERLYTGIRVTPGDPHALVADPARLQATLAEAVDACAIQDGAQAVIIGGGPLGQAAATLQPLAPVPVIAPIPAAVRRMVALLAHRG